MSLAFFLSLVPTAFAHPKDMTTSSLIVSQEGIRVQTVLPDALVETIRQATPENAATKRADLVAQGYQFATESGPCSVADQPRAWHLADIDARRYVVDYRCPNGLPSTLTLTYTLAGVSKSTNHENFFQAQIAGQTLDTVLTARENIYSIPLEHLLSQSSVTVPSDFAGQAIPTPGPVDFLFLGIKHILVGTDHIVFIAGLFLLTMGWGAMFSVITAFTVGHSLTLALSGLGFYTMTPWIAESIIALSIVYLGAENLYTLYRNGNEAGERGRSAARRRWAVAGLFGLIHGFGFSYVLKDLGLPEGSLWSSLAGFNLGVEIGQLLILSIFVPVLAWMLRYFNPAAIAGLCSTSILAVGCWWLAERTLMG